MDKQKLDLVQVRDWLLPILINGQMQVGSGEYGNEEVSLGMVADGKRKY